jgi:hypothetical protein
MKDKLNEFKKEIESKLNTSWILDEGVRKLAVEDFSNMFIKFEESLSEVKEKENPAGRKVHPDSVKNLERLKKLNK